ncbi:hypothetical protein GI582_05935 [Sulfitobacter sp. BDSS02]|nr:hypothetical protein [Sulfitobacter sp. BDSS02]MBR9848578.1 hypothetical protein [Paracoccaceae bacterium]
MSDNKYENGHCSKCGSQRADIVAEHTDEYQDENFHAVTHYRILECRGCGYHYFKSSSSNSEDYDHYETGNGDYETIHNETIHYWPPAYERRSPDWVDEIGLTDRVLGSLFEDVYTALDNNLGVLGVAP